MQTIKEVNIFLSDTPFCVITDGFGEYCEYELYDNRDGYWIPLSTFEALCTVARDARAKYLAKRD